MKRTTLAMLCSLLVPVILAASPPTLAEPGPEISDPPVLSLPWANGETWYYTGGPHVSYAGGVPYQRAAVDFAPGGGSGCFSSSAWVRAAAAGTVVWADCNFVRIDHGGGWSTGYNHLSGLQVSLNQWVAAGTALGHPSCGTGQACGWDAYLPPTGSHVHLDIRYSNVPQAIHGRLLGGWTVLNGAGDYAGTMVQGSTVKNAHVAKNSDNAILAAAPASVYLTVAALLRDVLSNPRGHSSELELVVTHVGSHDALYTAIVTTDVNGVYTGLPLSGILPGRYDLYAKPSTYLRRKLGNVNLVAGMNIADFSVGGTDKLWPGDIDVYGQDNQLNMADYSRFVELYLEYISDPPPSSDWADFNRDGRPSMADYTIFVNSYLENREGGDGWAGGGPFATGGLGEQASRSPDSTPGTLTLSPSSGSYPVGTMLNVNVWLSTGTYDSDGTNLTVLYDPGVLEVQDADPDMDGIQVIEGNVYEFYMDNYAFPSQGVLSVSSLTNIGNVYRGSGLLATIPFKVVRAISQTAVRVYFRDAWSADSNIAEAGTALDVLGTVTSASFGVSGTPARSMPAVSLTPLPNTVLRSSVIELQAHVSDAWNHVDQVRFEANTNGAWSTIGTDTYSLDGWSTVWDASSAPHGRVGLRAVASLLGGQGTTLASTDIILDKQSPTLVSARFSPASAPSPGTPVTLRIKAADVGSGVDRVEVYANGAGDGSQDGAWVLLGTLAGDEGTLLWNTTGYSPGVHRLAFHVWDKAGNWAVDPQPTYYFGIGTRTFYIPLAAGGYGPAPANSPPHQPSSPLPADGSAGYNVHPTLAWSGGDPDGDPVAYDVYLEAGDSSPDVRVCSDQFGPQCDPGWLDSSTDYYWQVVATDSHGHTTAGPVWDLTTASSCAFSDDMSDSASGWPDGGAPPAVYGYEKGAYQVNLAERVVWLKNPRTWCGDSVVDVDANVLDFTNPMLHNIHVGVLVRYTDSTNWIAFQVCPDGHYRIQKRVGGVFTDLVPWTYSAAIRQGVGQNHLSVRTSGSQITVGVNNQTLTTVSDTSFSSGYGGLVAGTSVDQSLSASFDNYSQAPAY